jgi:hypothetical protein
LSLSAFGDTWNPTTTVGGLQIVWVAQLLAGVILWVALMVVPCVHAYHGSSPGEVELTEEETKAEEAKADEYLATTNGGKLVV